MAAGVIIGNSAMREPQPVNIMATTNMLHFTKSDKFVPVLDPLGAIPTPDEFLRNIAMAVTAQQPVPRALAPPSPSLRPPSAPPGPFELVASTRT
jgi:hypothetical protein